MKCVSSLSCSGGALRQIPSFSQSFSRCFLGVVLFVNPAFPGPVAASELEGKGPLEKKINLIVEDFSGRLGISSQVTVDIVPTNAHLASVAKISEEGGAFKILLEREFLRTLDDRELSAAVAHELGHVWIFTHFPYLQTETLANQQALKLVSRGDLGKVYEKVWQWSGKRGDLEKVLGPVDDRNAARGIR